VRHASANATRPCLRRPGAPEWPPLLGSRRLARCRERRRQRRCNGDGKTLNVHEAFTRRSNGRDVQRRLLHVRPALDDLRWQAGSRMPAHKIRDGEVAMSTPHGARPEPLNVTSGALSSSLDRARRRPPDHRVEQTFERRGGIRSCVPVNRRHLDDRVFARHEPVKSGCAVAARRLGQPRIRRGRCANRRRDCARMPSTSNPSSSARSSTRPTRCRRRIRVSGHDTMTPS